MTIHVEARLDALEEALREIRDLLDEARTFIAMTPRGGPNMQDVLRWRFVKDLPELCRQHPDGVTRQVVSGHYNIPEPSVSIALTELSRAAKIQWVKRKNDKFKIALPLGVPVPAAGMTTARRKVMDAILQSGVMGDVVSISHRQLALATGQNPSNIAYVLSVLLQQDRLKVIRHGSGGRPSTYRITALTPQQRSWERA